MVPLAVVSAQQTTMLPVRSWEYQVFEDGKNAASNA